MQHNSNTTEFDHTMIMFAWIDAARGEIIEKVWIGKLSAKYLPIMRDLNKLSVSCGNKLIALNTNTGEFSGITEQIKGFTLKTALQWFSQN